jgi:hypothetical protein
MSEQDNNVEVTVEGDAERPVDSHSGDDAYADGYSAARRGAQYDDAAYDDAAKVRYRDGWSVGAAEAQLAQPEREAGGLGEVAIGVAELLVPEIVGHLLKRIGPWSTLIGMATSPGGDTTLPPAPVYLPVCHRSDHGLSGDPILDGGAWSGTATIDYQNARTEATQHADTWQHTDGVVHIWEYRNAQWNPA